MNKNIQLEITSRKDRWSEFCQPVAEPGFMFLVNIKNENAPVPPPRWPDKKQERIEYAWNAYEKMLDRVEWLQDDRVPFLDNITGTEIFAEALGCKVERPDHTMPFALPCIFSAEEVANIKVPELSDSSLAYLFDIADELYRRGGQEAVMKPVDIQSPMDIAALVWDKASLLMAMLDTPEAVKELSAKCAELLTAFMDEWFSRYGTDFVAHYPDYFMRGGITLSEDEIGIVNEEMFTDFFRDELVNLSAHFGGIGIHCCADSGHQWQNLKDLPGLTVLNLCKPPTRPETFVTDAYEFFTEGPAQMHFGWMPNVGTAEVPKQFPVNARVIFELSAENKEEAIKICGTLNTLRG